MEFKKTKRQQQRNNKTSRRTKTHHQDEHHKQELIHLRCFVFGYSHIQSVGRDEENVVEVLGKYADEITSPSKVSTI